MREGSERHLYLTAGPGSPRTARDFATDVVDSWGLQVLADEVRLVTSELVTNAVRHARTALSLSLARDDVRGRLRIAVRDGSRVHPRRSSRGDLTTTGRGLAMVARTSQAFGVRPLAGGKEVWVELAVAPADDDSHAGSTG